MVISAVSATTLREAPPPRRQRLLQAAGAMIAIADRSVQGRMSIPKEAQMHTTTQSWSGSFHGCPALGL